MTQLIVTNDRTAPQSGAASDPAPQPTIAGVLGISYPTPISDRDGWARVFAEPSQAPAAPRAELFTGPLGELTRLIAPHVPWDPIAFHLQAVTVIGNYLGYGMSIPEGATARHPNLFLALIGGTGSGKGSSLGWVDWMMARIDGEYMRDRVTTAVGSGQGLLSKITDPVRAEQERRPGGGHRRQSRQAGAVHRGGTRSAVLQDDDPGHRREDGHEGVGLGGAGDPHEA